MKIALEKKKEKIEIKINQSPIKPKKLKRIMSLVDKLTPEYSCTGSKNINSEQKDMKSSDRQSAWDPSDFSQSKKQFQVNQKNFRKKMINSVRRMKPQQVGHKADSQEKKSHRFSSAKQLDKDIITTELNTGTTKKDSEPIEDIPIQFLAKLEVPPEEVLVVEDPEKEKSLEKSISQKEFQIEKKLDVISRDEPSCREHALMLLVSDSNQQDLTTEQRIPISLLEESKKSIDNYLKTLISEDTKFKNDQEPQLAKSEDQSNKKELGEEQNSKEGDIHSQVNSSNQDLKTGIILPIEKNSIVETGQDIQEKIDKAKDVYIPIEKIKEMVKKDSENQLKEKTKFYTQRLKFVGKQKRDRNNPLVHSENSNYFINSAIYILQ